MLFCTDIYITGSEFKKRSNNAYYKVIPKNQLHNWIDYGGYFRPTIKMNDELASYSPDKHYIIKLNIRDTDNVYVEDFQDVSIENKPNISIINKDDIEKELKASTFVRIPEDCKEEVKSLYKKLL